MSQHPPPPPYGGPPVPPYGGPPGPYPQAQPPSGMSNKAKFWIGVALTIPFIIVSGLISGAASAVIEGVSGDPSAGAAAAGIISLLLLAGFIAALVFERTRWFALGILAGTAILLILFAGACIVLIIGLSQSSN
jgi:hypothetical protein